MVTDKLAIKPALRLFFRINFRITNKVKVIKIVRMRGNRKSVSFISVTFSEYNKIIGNMLNKNGKMINLLLIVITIRFTSNFLNI
jgi:hypothetical protein